MRRLEIRTVAALLVAALCLALTLAAGNARLAGGVDGQVAVSAQAPATQLAGVELRSGDASGRLAALEGAQDEVEPGEELQLIARESSTRVDAVVIALWSIAVVMTVLLALFVWHTSPRRRLRLARSRSAMLEAEAASGDDPEPPSPESAVSGASSDWSEPGLVGGDSGSVGEETPGADADVWSEPGLVGGGDSGSVGEETPGADADVWSEPGTAVVGEPDPVAAETADVAAEPDPAVEDSGDGRV